MEGSVDAGRTDPERTPPSNSLSADGAAPDAPAAMADARADASRTDTWTQEHRFLDARGWYKPHVYLSVPPTAAVATTSSFHPGAGAIGGSAPYIRIVDTDPSATLSVYRTMAYVSVSADGPYLDTSGMSGTTLTADKRTWCTVPPKSRQKRGQEKG